MQQSAPHRVCVKDFSIGHGSPLTIISGPCVIEDEAHTLQCAESLQKIMRKFPVNFIFKACYDKANRSSLHSFRGPGIEEGLKILEKVKREYNLPVISDIHSPEEAAIAAKVCDVLQIPAFLCRQTDLIVAAAKTGRPLHIKKGQFLAPWDMKNVIDKVVASGNKNIIVADRGTSFGYNNLVSDMRSIAIMQRFGFPVSYDASHSVQLPGSQGDATGGNREFIPVLAKAAIAAGADVLFIETHPTPETAKSDSAVVYPLHEFSSLLATLVDIYQCVRKVR